MAPSQSLAEIAEDRAAIAQDRASRKKAPQINTLICPPDRHVSVSNPELKAALKNRLQLEHRAMFDDLCKLIEGVANFDFFDLKQRMRTNFLPFASGARNQIYLQRNTKNLPSTTDLDQKEADFIADVYEVLYASHYRLLLKVSAAMQYPCTVCWCTAADRIR